MTEEKEISAILETVRNAVYPKLFRDMAGEGSLLPEDMVKIPFYDMELVFYIKTPQGETLYVKPPLKEMLEEGGSDIQKAALDNYGRDSSVFMKLLPGSGKTEEEKVYSVFGGPDMSPVLLCPFILEKIGDICGNHYRIIFVSAEYLLVIPKTAREEKTGEICREFLKDKELLQLSDLVYQFDMETKKLMAVSGRK